MFNCIYLKTNAFAFLYSLTTSCWFSRELEERQKKRQELAQKTEQLVQVKGLIAATMASVEKLETQIQQVKEEVVHHRKSFFFITKPNHGDRKNI